MSHGEPDKRQWKKNPATVEGGWSGGAVLSPSDGSTQPRCLRSDRRTLNGPRARYYSLMSFLTIYCEAGRLITARSISEHVVLEKRWV